MMIQATGLTHYYGPRPAIEDVNFTVERVAAIFLTVVLSLVIAAYQSGVATMLQALDGLVFGQLFRVFRLPTLSSELKGIGKEFRRVSDYFVMGRSCRGALR